MSLEVSIDTRIQKINSLINGNFAMPEYFEAATLCQSVLHDTLGCAHPIAAILDQGVKEGNWQKIKGAAQTVITLYQHGALKSPRLIIAHEIEGDILNIAEAQAKAAEKNTDVTQKQTQLGIAAFLGGASLEDALRRLCDAHQIEYDQQRSAISKLQSSLYQPSKQIEIISSSESKQITSWGDTRNKADHGKFGEITITEVTMMVMGVRAFIDKHLS